MYVAITRGIEVAVEPDYRADRSDPARGRYFWTYTIEITNRGPLRIQLISRHWRITDGHGQLEEVRGLGVVGEQPVLKPGDAFRYTSGCPLTTPSGIMAGTFTMVDAAEHSFEVTIPAFSLDSPSDQRTLN